MNLQGLVVVALRLMALSSLMSGIVQLISFAIQMARFAERSPFDNSTALTIWVGIGGMFAWAVLLWVFAFPVAKLVTRRLPLDISLKSITLADCYSVMFMGIGLYYVAGYLARVLNRACYLFKESASCYENSWIPKVDVADIAQAFIPFIAGIILFVYGRRWALALSRKHTATAVENASESDT